jgi:hypothetical protein
MLTPPAAEHLLKAATFRIHLGPQPDPRTGTLADSYATGFFVGTTGLALSAWHNFVGCNHGQRCAGPHSAREVVPH